MATIKVGNIFTAKFGGKEEHRFEVLLGGLPTTYAIVSPFKSINVEEDRYKLALELNEDQYNEVHDAMLAKLIELNEAGGYGATKKQLEEVLGRAVGESTLHPGKYRFYGSRKMGFADKETGEAVAINLPVYEGEQGDDNRINGKVSLGAGSVVRSAFVVSLFKSGKQVLLNINPSKVIVISRVEPPKRDAMSHEGLDDTPSAYDF